MRHVLGSFSCILASSLSLSRLDERQAGQQSARRYACRSVRAPAEAPLSSPVVRARPLPVVSLGHTHRLACMLQRCWRGGEGGARRTFLGRRALRLSISSTAGDGFCCSTRRICSSTNSRFSRMLSTYRGASRSTGAARAVHTTTQRRPHTRQSASVPPDRHGDQDCIAWHEPAGKSSQTAGEEEKSRRPAPATRAADLNRSAMETAHKARRATRRPGDRGGRHGRRLKVSEVML